MKILNIHQAKITLCQFLESALAGEEAIVSKAGKLLARLVPDRAEKKPRIPGYWKGRVKMAEDFDAPLPPEILAGFLGMDDEVIA